VVTVPIGTAWGSDKFGVASSATNNIGRGGTGQKKRNGWDGMDG